MKILILEDEPIAQRELSRMVAKILPEAVISCLDSIKTASLFLAENSVDLIFSDIELTDGQSFDLFRQVKTDIPVIFTTAYDNYALQAFKHNGLDYLLKPYDEELLASAVKKFRKQFQKQAVDTSPERRIEATETVSFKERFLVSIGDQLKTIPIDNVAYFYAEGNTVYLVPKTGAKVIVDYSLEDLCKGLDPKHFFRINRKLIVSFVSIKKIHKYFNSRLALELTPNNFEETVVVSREKCKSFTLWLKS